MVIFNTHRMKALILILIASTIGWYSLVLLTTSEHDCVSIDNNQYIGLCILIFLSVGGWFADCLTLKTHTH